MTKEPALAWLRSQTLIRGNSFYTDTATEGLLCNNLPEWRRQSVQVFYEGRIAWEHRTSGLPGETREAVASFFGADYAGVALTP